MARSDISSRTSTVPSLSTRELFGFKVAHQAKPAFASVARDDLTLWLSDPQSSGARLMPDGRRPEPRGWNRLVLAVKDLPAHVDEMKRKGVRFRNEIVVGPAGKQIVLEAGAD
jgi:glyoxylase I family protein